MADFRFITPDIDIAFVIIPRRDTVSPPKLTADTPVLDITHPCHVHIFVLGRDKLGAPVFYRLDGRFCQFFDGYIPLVSEPRLNDGVTAVAFGHF